MQSCQWCGSTEHVSGLCRDQQGTKLHAQSFRRSSYVVDLAIWRCVVLQKLGGGALDVIGEEDNGEEGEEEGEE